MLSNKIKNLVQYEIQDFVSLNETNAKSYESITLSVSTKSKYLLHRVLTNQLVNKRSGNACTKTRSEVTGGGKKPWKQKGTGNARAGSSNSPLWKGGGVTFGPRTKMFSKKINKKERLLALTTALYLKSQSTKIVNLDKMDFSNFKTKQFFVKLNNLLDNYAKSKKILFIVEPKHNNLWRYLRNIPNVDLIYTTGLDLKKILQAQQIIFTHKALNDVKEVLNEQ